MDLIYVLLVLGVADTALMLYLLSFSRKDSAYVINHCQFHGMWRTPSHQPLTMCPKCKQVGTR